MNKEIFIPLLIWIIGFIIGLVEGSEFGFWSAHIGNILLHFLYNYDHAVLPFIGGQIGASFVLLFHNIYNYTSILLVFIYTANILIHYKVRH